MKKLLLSSVSLLLFSISILIFQISCEKDVNSSPSSNNNNNNNNNNTVLNKIVYSSFNNSTFVIEYWICDIDGSNKSKINVNIPANKKLDLEVSLSPDGKKIIFTAKDNITTANSGGVIYSCNLDGTNLNIIDNSNNSVCYYSLKTY